MLSQAESVSELRDLKKGQKFPLSLVKPAWKYFLHITQRVQKVLLFIYVAKHWKFAARVSDLM